MASSSTTTTTWKYEAIPEDAPDEHSENILKPTTFAASSALVDGKGGGDVTVDSLSSKNIGIHLSYFAVGIVSRIIQAPLQYYLIHQLGMSSTTYSGNIALNKLPWTFKVCYGVVVDAVPLFGRRRKPWMTVGWGFVVIISFIFAAMGSPSVYPTVFLYFGITFFEVLADVATDSLAVDLSFYEPEQQRGGLQTTGYIFRSSGKIIGALIGTYLFNNHISTTTKHTHFPTFAKIGDMFMLQGIIIAVSTFGFLYPLQEFAPHKRGFTEVGHAVRALLGDIWQVLQLRAVWRPMAFLFVYNVMQVPNPAWSNFIVVGLGFSSRDLGYLSLGSSLISLAGYTFFRVYLFDTSWRLIYVSTSVVALVFTLLEVLLAMRINVALGVPDIWFAVGEDLILTFVEIVHVMPYIILFTMICPVGAEGTTFALLTTTSALAGAVSSAIGGYMSIIWDVSNATLGAQDFSGVIKLTISTGIMNFAPIALVFLLPNGRKEHQEEIDKGVSSFWGGAILVATLLLSLLFTVVSSFWLLL